MVIGGMCGVGLVLRGRKILKLVPSFQPRGCEFTYSSHPISLDAYGGATLMAGRITPLHKTWVDTNASGTIFGYDRRVSTPHLLGVLHHKDLTKISAGTTSGF
jgi:hypothetical protein